MQSRRFLQLGAQPVAPQSPRGALCTRRAAGRRDREAAGRRRQPPLSAGLPSPPCDLCPVGGLRLRGGLTAMDRGGGGRTGPPAPAGRRKAASNPSRSSRRARAGLAKVTAGPGAAGCQLRSQVGSRPRVPTGGRTRAPWPDPPEAARRRPGLPCSRLARAASRPGGALSPQGTAAPPGSASHSPQCHCPRHSPCGGRAGREATGRCRSGRLGLRETFALSLRRA